MSNPLVDIDLVPDFSRIKAAHVVPAVDQLLEQSKAGLEAVANHDGPRTYDNTMAALENATLGLEKASAAIEHLESVATDGDFRAAYNATKPRIAQFFSSIPLHDGLWRALVDFSNGAEATKLDPTRRRFLETTMDDFRRHGAGLPAQDKTRLEAINLDLANLTTQFAQNVLDATNAYELVLDTEERLTGMPASAIAAARQSAKERGKKGYRLTLHAPSLIPTLLYADDATLREEIYRAYSQRAASGDKDNRALLGEILRLRREKASLLGYRDFADMVLEDRMAKTGATAQGFIDDLRDKTLVHFARENAELEAFWREQGNAQPMAAWDVAYAAEQQREARYDFDEEELRPYFSAEGALRGLFAVASRVFGVKVEEDPSLPVWHDAVRTFLLRDGDGSLLARFYVDLYPRDSKRGGAWMAPIVTSVPPSPHIGVFCANVTPPLGDAPALLTHNEVETLFHEFGHLLHHCLSRVPVRSLAGTHVPWDFVELPSQIMENWCWARESLDLFARHHETDQPIPPELLEKMLRARTYRAANLQMRQIAFAAVDLALHRDYAPAKDGDVVTYARAIMNAHNAVALPDDYAMIASFSHLFASPVGYAAGYYSYKWAEVLDADAFTRFRRDGIFAPEVGEAFRKEILARGNSRDPMELYVSFMGREPSVDALLERQGMTASSGGTP